MNPTAIVQTQLLFGYLTWAIVLAIFVLPRLAALPRANAMRAIAGFHAFRFFGLVFILPGLIGSSVPAGFAVTAAYGDFATAILALAALVTFRVRPLFWAFAVAFNVVGAGGLILDTVNAARMNIPAWAGDLGFTYAIPILYVPALMLTHAIAFWLMLRRPVAAPASAILQSATVPS